MSIPFNRSPRMEGTLARLDEALRGPMSGDGPFTKQCAAWLRQATGAPGAFLTTSGSHALDMAAILSGVGPGDEVIMPSYTFSATANAFVGRGATIVFVDVRPDTMNLDEALVEGAITPKTRAVVPMHYAGVACEMDAIGEIARRHGLAVVEDAAQGILAAYKGRALGALGDFGCYSFHETKNFSMGEGGALLVMDPARFEATEILREKGTDRSKFFRGQIDKYSWVEWGSSYLPSELNAAYLWSQLECARDILDDRMATWDFYRAALAPLAESGRVAWQHIPEGCIHNAHMFWLKARDLDERTRLLAFMRERGIGAVFHYVPLHSAKAGRKYGRFHGRDVHTTRESERLLRLPLFYGLPRADAETVAQAVLDFYKSN